VRGGEATQKKKEKKEKRREGPEGKKNKQEERRKKKKTRNERESTSNQDVQRGFFNEHSETGLGQARQNSKLVERLKKNMVSSS
jgi:hypothetical protein